MHKLEDIKHNYELECEECHQSFEKDDYNIFPICPHDRTTPYIDRYGRNQIDYTSQMSCPWKWDFGGNNLVVSFDCYDNDNSKVNSSESYFYENIIKGIEKDEVYSQPFRVVFHDGGDRKYIPDFYIEGQKLIVEVRGHSTTDEILSSNREKLHYMVNYPTLLNDCNLTPVSYLFISELGCNDYKEYGYCFIKIGKQHCQPALVSIDENGIEFGTYDMLDNHDAFLILGFKDYKIHLVPIKKISSDYNINEDLLFEYDNLYENYAPITLCELVRKKINL
ncbi:MULTISPECIES: hypothetical protein [Bacillus cereus group]|uniref:hypothetical protein n=1 Tax=Bacillus cereus group TaxID=86661 RepID=UPI0011A3ECE6|nr:hypothetical protein [Bacillus tropicus]